LSDPSVISRLMSREDEYGFAFEGEFSLGEFDIGNQVHLQF